MNKIASLSIICLVIINSHSLFIDNSSTNLNGLRTNINNSNASFIGAIESYNSGWSISFVGDVNGDGYDDILIGAHGSTNGGKSYLIFGKSSGWSNNSTLSEADASFQGEVWGDKSGYSVSGVGDVNGDGFDDFLIGAYFNSENGQYSGQTYLILGKKTGWGSNISLSNSDASFLGEKEKHNSGRSVSGAGDVNGDGYDDLLIGAPSAGYKLEGRTYLFFGKSNGWKMDTPISRADVIFNGVSWYDRSGCAVSGGGDINGDGYDDIIIGAKDNGDKKSDAGATYLILGHASNWTSLINLKDANASYYGETQNDHSGEAVSNAGDVNGDGYDDILIGARQKTQNVSEEGKAYLILGKKNGWSKGVSLSSANASFYGENQKDNSGWKVSGGGDVNGDGYDDILISSMLNDYGGYEAGQVYLILGKSFGWMRNTPLKNSDASYYGENEYDSLGSAIADNGDINGDGHHDILIGAHMKNHDRWYVGKTYLIIYKNNEQPIITSEDNLTATEDMTYNNQYHAKDEETIQKFLRWSYSSNATWLEFDERTINLKGIPKNEDVGEYWVNISVMDVGGETDWTNFTLIVENSNDSPLILTTNVQTCNEDDSYFVEYKAIDIDSTNDKIYWTYESNATWLEFDVENAILKGTPRNKDVGEYWVNISVSDDWGGLSWENFTIKVENTNDPPIIINDNNLLILHEDSFFEFLVNGSDIDPTNDVFSWSILSTDSEYLTLNEQNGKISGTPENEDVGNGFIEVMVEDGMGGYCTQNFSLLVSNENDNPIIKHTFIPNAQEDESYHFTINAYDPDPTEDILEYDMISNATFLSIDIGSGIINGIPENSDIGCFWVNIIVTDNNGGMDIWNYTFSVVGTNDEPELKSNKSLYFIINKDNSNKFHLDLNTYFIDIDGDVLLFKYQGSDDYYVNIVNGVLTYFIENHHIGTIELPILVSDGIIERKFIITIELVIENHSPKIISIDYKNRYEAGTMVNLSVSYYDEDILFGDIIQIVWNSDIQGIIGDNSDINIELIPGNHTIEIAITDSKGETVSHNISIEIFENNGKEPDADNGGNNEYEEDNTSSNNNLLFPIIILITIFIALLIASTIFILVLKRRRHFSGEDSVLSAEKPYQSTHKSKLQP